MQTTLVASHVAPVAPDAAALTVTGLLQSVAMELTIFATTVMFAVVIKQYGARSSSCAAAAAAEARRDATRVGPASTSPPRTSDCVAGGRRADTRYQPAHASLRAMATFDEVVARAGNSPSKAISLYAELRALSTPAFAEALQLAKHSPEEVYDALISCVGRSKRPELIQDLFRDMQRVGVAPTLALYESAMRSLAGQYCYKQALEVYERLEADGLQPSLVTLGCSMKNAAEVGDLDLAIRFFDRLSAEGVPNIRAYTSALRLFAKRKDWSRSLAVYRDCQGRGGGVDGIILNITLATGVAAGALGPAKALLREASEAKPQIVDVISFNTVLKGCAQRNEADTALSLIARMSELGLSPNAITFNTTLDAAVRCSERAGSRLGAADNVWRVYAAMRSAGLRPDKFTCSTLVKGVPFYDAPHLSFLLGALEEVGVGLPRLASALEIVLDRAAALRYAGRSEEETTTVTQRARRLMEAHCA